ncbi:MAG: hypothetical protein U0Q16_02270 [Bryobacteraceae bacterium]
MNPQADLIPYVVAWLPLVAVVVGMSFSRKRPASGLVAAYTFQMWLLYWLGAMIHCLPWCELPESDLTFLGFQQATCAMTAFVAGCLAAPLLLGSSLERVRAAHAVSPDYKLPVFYFCSGLVAYAVLVPLIGRIPSLNALTSVGSQLIVVGICLGCWSAWLVRSQRRLVNWLLAALLLPAATILAQGFLGYGTMALALVLVFVARFVQPRWLLPVAGLAALYGGLSFYSAYMRDRNEIRASVWGGEAASSRIARLRETVLSIEPFDFRNGEHLERVDGRINQNGLVGAAVTFLAATGEYARGETLWTAALGLIPRAIWPDKPQSGGSGDWVSRFTGITFAQGTSVGIGPVLELYANFTTWGVVIGFAILGLLLRFLDIASGGSLEAGRWRQFAAYFLVGVSCLNVSGSFVEVTSSVVASACCAKLVNSLA